MNAQRTITLTFGYTELVSALKGFYPESIHIQSLPQVGGAGLSMETTAGKGLTVKYTTNVATVEKPKDQPLLLIGG